MIVRSHSEARVRELLDDYTARVARDYHAAIAPQNKPSH
jgi:hypothetical protein